MARPRRSQAFPHKPGMTRARLARVSRRIAGPAAVSIAAVLATNTLMNALSDEGGEAKADSAQFDMQDVVPQDEQQPNYIERDPERKTASASQEMNKVSRSKDAPSGHAADARKEPEKSPQKAGQDTPKAQIRAACEGTGVDPDIAIAIAYAESKLRHDAVNSHPDSSATGYFQFVFNTFKEYVYNHAEELGYPELAEKVELHKTRLNNGKYKFHYKLADGMSKQDFMQHAKDGYLNAALGCRIIASSAETLKNKGLRPTPTNLYAMHFLGGRNGLEILDLYHIHEFHHHAPSDYLSQAAINNNREIFFHNRGNGPERSVGQVMAIIEGKMNEYRQAVELSRANNRQTTGPQPPG